MGLTVKIDRHILLVMVHDLITQEDAAQMLDVSPRTILRWLNRGWIPFVFVGSRRYLTRQLLDEWMRSSRRDSEQRS